MRKLNIIVWIYVFITFLRVVPPFRDYETAFHVNQRMKQIQNIDILKSEEAK